MSDVFREIALPWRGEEYHITPSMALLRRVKAKGVNALALANACVKGGADPIDLTDVHQVFMAAAGVPVSEDESYAFITGGSDEMIEFQLAFVSAVLPSVALGKKPNPRPTTARGKKAAET
jgi:hypothetical protein